MRTSFLPLEGPQPVRRALARKLELGEIVEHPSDGERDTVEVLSASFRVRPGTQHWDSERTLFGAPNDDYIRREIAWYESGSLDVNDLEAPVPEIWRRVATPDGIVNSNYGWCIYSDENGRQFEMAARALEFDESSRQATMIYQRPSMHAEWDRGGKHDFICTNAVHVFVRKRRLHYVVSMRSNDAVFGYRNDVAWHEHVQRKMLTRLQGVYPDLRQGAIYWNAASLHVYRRHFDLVKKWVEENNA